MKCVGAQGISLLKRGFKSHLSHQKASTRESTKNVSPGCFFAVFGEFSVNCRIFCNCCDVLILTRKLAKMAVFWPFNCNENCNEKQSRISVSKPSKLFVFVLFGVWDKNPHAVFYNEHFPEFVNYTQRCIITRAVPISTLRCQIVPIRVYYWWQKKEGGADAPPSCQM